MPQTYFSTVSEILLSLSELWDTRMNITELYKTVMIDIVTKALVYLVAMNSKQTTNYKRSMD